MSPVDHQAGGRGRYAPADQLNRLAVDLGDAASDHPDLFADEVFELCDLQTVAQAYADLLGSDDPEAFVKSWSEYTRDRLVEIQTELEEDTP